MFGRKRYMAAGHSPANWRAEVPGAGYHGLATAFLFCRAGTGSAAVKAFESCVEAHGNTGTQPRCQAPLVPPDFVGEVSTSSPLRPEASGAAFPVSPLLARVPRSRPCGAVDPAPS